MSKLAEYARLLLFVAGVLIGIQLPGFVDQYGNALRAHLIESQTGLKAFQDDANCYFDGDLHQLTEHYQASGDAVFRAGGDSLRVLISRHDRLNAAFSDFESSPFHAYLSALLNPLPDIRQEVVDHYSYRVLLKPSAIVIGLVCGLLAMILLDLFFGGCGWCVRRCRRPRTVRHNSNS